MISIGMIFITLLYNESLIEYLLRLEDNNKHELVITKTTNAKQSLTQESLNQHNFLANKAQHEEDNTGDYIYDCSDVIVPQIQNPQQVHTDFISQLKSSSSPEHQLSAILFDHNLNEKERFDLLIEYKNNQLESPSLMLDIIGRCSDREISCNDDLFAQAIELEGNNSALWLHLANYYFAEKNESMAFDAMNNAIKASEFNDYYYNDLALYMRTSKGLLDVHLSHRVIASIGIFAAKPLWISEMANFCLNNEHLSEQENFLCLEVGKLMEYNASLHIANVIGIQFQEKAYEREGNDELVASLNAKAKKGDNWSTLHNDSFVLSTFDEGLFEYWLDSAINHGEYKAQQLLIEEAITLSKNQYYNPCPVN